MDLALAINIFLRQSVQIGGMPCEGADLMPCEGAGLQIRRFRPLPIKPHVKIIGKG